MVTAVTESFVSVGCRWFAKDVECLNCAKRPVLLTGGNVFRTVQPAFDVLLLRLGQVSIFSGRVLGNNGEFVRMMPIGIIGFQTHVTQWMEHIVHV